VKKAKTINGEFREKKMTGRKEKGIKIEDLQGG
jgi:hypothetical protein